MALRGKRQVRGSVGYAPVLIRLSNQNFTGAFRCDPDHRTNAKVEPGLGFMKDILFGVGVLA